MIMDTHRHTLTDRKNLKHRVHSGERASERERKGNKKSLAKQMYVEM